MAAAHCRLQAAPHCTAHYCTTALALVDTMHCTILHYSCTLHYVSVSRMCDCHHWSSQLAMTCGWKKPSDPIRLSDQGNTAQYRLMCLNRKSSEKVIRSPRGAAIIPHFTALLLYWTLLCYTLLHSTTLYTALQGTILHQLQSVAASRITQLVLHS